MKKLASRFFYFYAIARLLAIPTLGWGSSGTEGASFLNIPVGARPAALGSGYTALATDAYAPTWNPAGLGFVDSTQMAAQHLSYLESIHYEYLSLVHPFAVSRDSAVHRALGTSIQYLGSGDIAGTDINGNSIGDFSAHYAAYNVAYGQTISDKLAVGVTAKWINAKIADVGANAIAADLGAMYKVNSRLMLGGTLTNIGNKLKFIQAGDALPLAFHVGAAIDLLPQVSLNSEVEYRKTGLAAFHVGTEWRPIEPVALRIGYRTDTLKQLSPMAGMTMGIGLKVMGQEFSYAWLPYGELGNTQYFSLTIHFGKAGEAKRNMIQYQTIKEHRSVKNDGSAADYQQLMELMDEKKAPVAATPSPKKSRNN